MKTTVLPKSDELQKGTTTKRCANCPVEFVVIEELAESTHYCSKECEEHHSIFNQELQ